MRHYINPDNIIKKLGAITTEYKSKFSNTYRSLITTKKRTGYREITIRRRGGRRGRLLPICLMCGEIMESLMVAKCPCCGDSVRK